MVEEFRRSAETWGWALPSGFARKPLDVGTLGGSSGVLNSFACYVLRACLLVTWWERRPCGLRLLGQASWWKFYGNWLATRGKSTSASGKSSGDGAGARVAARFVLEDHETAILEVERQVELLEKRVRDVDTFAAVVDTMETRVQETQKVVAEFVIKSLTRACGT